MTLDPYPIARELIAARTRAGLSQAQVAERMGTSQSTVARLESGRTLPSLRTLDRYARATGSKTVLRLEATVVLEIDRLTGRATGSKTVLRLEAGR